MCGAGWRNSVYQSSSTWWENPGYDDRGWQAAADLGVNGVAPWFKRPQVRKTPSWPRNWANFSLLQLYSRRDSWANLHRLGQPNIFLAAGRREGALDLDHRSR